MKENSLETSHGIFSYYNGGMAAVVSPFIECVNGLVTCCNSEKLAGEAGGGRRRQERRSILNAHVGPDAESDPVWCGGGLVVLDDNLA